MKSILAFMAIVAFLYSCNKAEVSEWRPGNRTGVSAETGLLASWPDGGPLQLWTYAELPTGYSSP
ncbi:MAG: polyvinylalcohol dehydrogenase, partial [Bacteroidota bacterium]